jgi:hypothetical protein
MRRHRLAIIIIAALVIIGSSISIWVEAQKTKPEHIVWGLTYTPIAAQRLSLNTHDTYLAVLNELKPKKLRLVAYWNEIEPKKNNFNFSELDFETAEAAKRHIPVVIAVGQKVPRYPECFLPDWVSKTNQPSRQADLLKFIDTTVNRFNSDTNVAAWQIENEATLSFGICPKYNQAQLKEEIKLMRSLTTKELVMTDSGELSLWIANSRFSDTFGSTLYRAVLNGRHNEGVFHHFLPPFAYTLRGAIVKKIHPNVRKIIVAELQAEPWGAKALIDEDKAHYDKTMNHTQFDRNINFARDTGAAEVWLWGTEWWYYEKLHGDPYFWDEAAKLYERSTR